MPQEPLLMAVEAFGSISMSVRPERPIGPALDRISVCVCTFKRPELLSALLAALISQQTDASFDCEIVVVDNDVSRSAELVVADARCDAPMRVVYECQPARNISLTRNLAIRLATGNLIAFIDDDECPSSNWLLLLHQTMREHKADGVFAPVLPAYPPEAPVWLVKGRFFERRRHPTGTRIGSDDARTGNVLLNRAMFDAGGEWFDAALGRTGGEDTDFFARQVRFGRVFVWCDEATVREDVPPGRWRQSFHIRRLWRSGTISGEWMRSGRLPSSRVVRNAIGVVVLLAALPVAVIMPKHLRVRALQKLAYCTGVVAAFLGVSVLRERE